VELKEKSPSLVEQTSVIADEIILTESSNVIESIPNSIVPDAIPEPSLLPDLLMSDVSAATAAFSESSAAAALEETPEPAAASEAEPSLLPSKISSPFNDLFDAAIETLKSEPEAKLDLLDPLMDAGGEAETKTTTETSANAALLDFGEPIIPIASSSSVAMEQTSQVLSTVTTETAADPFGAWDESDPVADKLEEDGVVASSDDVAAAKEDVIVDAKSADVEGDSFGDDWGDDAWGEDLEEGQEDDEEVAAAASAAAAVKMRGAGVKSDVDAMLEDELDLDLDDVNLENVDTSDLNLSDDLLSD